MKRLLLSALLLVSGLMAMSLPAEAGNVYPYTNPTYLPNSVATSVTLSAPGTYTFNNSGSGTLAINVSGTCTALAATAQVSVDGTNYVTVNVWPVTTGAIAAASSVGAAGAWRVDIAGSQSVKLNVTALTASCTFTMVGSPVAFTSTY